MIDKINNLIGKPYNAKTFNCYHLVQVLVECAPDYDSVASRLTQTRHLNEDDYTGLTVVTEFIDGDIILLGREFKKLHHAGVYHSGLIIHAEYPAVAACSISDMLKLYPVMKGLRCTV